MTPCALCRGCLALALLFAAVECGRPTGHAGGDVIGGPAGPAAAMPTGDLSGVPQSETGALVVNPLAGRPAAVARGKALFVQMNCAGCHGYDLGGAMGPNLTDRYWRYGGTPGAIYQSIADGRPQGMPAWRKALPPSDIWSLVSYVQSYGGTTAPDDYQAGQQGDVAALPVTPSGVSPSPTPAPTATGQLAHP
ncbi:MAG TPA: c-type cytochrome [Caulobacteraceae bacterium]